MGSELSSCPFCGGQASVKNSDLSDRGTFIVYCNECASTSGAAATDELAASAWNTRAMVPMLPVQNELGERMTRFWSDQAEWSRSAFGPDDRGPKGPLKHLGMEAQEALNDVTMGSTKTHEEIADCFLLLLDAARTSGLTLSSLLDEASSKLAVNKTRVWRQPGPDGVSEHVRMESEH